MYIKSATIKNFKSIDSITLTFCKGINAITGNNGTGKSNILEAIQFVTENTTPVINNNFDNNYPASVEISFTDNRLNEYKISKTLFADGKIEISDSNNINSGDFNIILLDYNSNSTMDSSELSNFAKDLKEKGKSKQIIIVTLAKQILDIADNVLHIAKADNKTILSSPLEV